MAVEAIDIAEAVTRAAREAVGRDSAALHEPSLSDAERAAVAQCIDDGWVSSAGPVVERFEAELAARVGTRYAVATASGTAALHLALLCAGVRPGEEVIAPALTFVATANAIAHCGGVPHFADCTETDLGLDPAALERHLDAVAVRRGAGTFNRRTGRRLSAVLAVHVFGHPADLDGLSAVCAAWRLPLVEDAAEALGSTYDGRHVGGFGRAGIFSFNGNKIVTTGGGGAVVTDDDDVARRARHLATTARRPHRWRYDHDAVAFNYRMPGINAALGCAQLGRLDGFLAAKRRLFARYRRSFAGLPGVTLLAEPDRARSNYWLNTLLLDVTLEDRQADILEALHAAGLRARPAWTPVHELPMYRAAQRDRLPVTESLARRIVNLPSSAFLA